MANDLLALANQIEAAAHDLEANLFAIADVIGDRVLEKAHKYSSGDISLAESAANDYLYAKKHGSPKADPSIINKQTGQYYAAWVKLGPTMTIGEIHVVIANFDPVADLLRLGTRFMFARPVQDRVIAEMVPIINTLVAGACTRALSRIT